MKKYRVEWGTEHVFFVTAADIHAAVCSLQPGYFIGSYFDSDDDRVWRGTARSGCHRNYAFRVTELP